MFQSESRLYICLNVKEVFIWSLSDCNGTRTNNSLVRKPTLKQLVKLTKWLSCILSPYLCGAFHCMYSSCHVHISELIYTLYLTECEGTSSSKQAPYLKFKWLQRDSNPEPLTSKTNSQQLIWTDQMIKLNYKYLSVPCVWLYVLVMSNMRFIMNSHSIFAWMSSNSLLETGAISEV